MPAHLRSLMGAFVLAGLAACGPNRLVTDAAREVSVWTPPNGFSPSYVCRDEHGTFWGLFVSKRMSAKDNLWAVQSLDGRTWTDPLLIDNAYAFEKLNFRVQHDSFLLTYYSIAPEYFPDHELGLGAFVDNKDELELSFGIGQLATDRDRDGLPDNVERELTISPRLPDSDLDGKPDAVDFNPTLRPRSDNPTQQIYSATLREILRRSGLDTLKSQTDSAWTRYYGVVTLVEQHPVYVAFPEDATVGEFVDFPVPLIVVRNRLWFGSRPRYRSAAGGTIPYLFFEAVKCNLFGNHAEVRLESALTSERIEEYRFALSRKHGTWIVDEIRSIAPGTKQPD